MQTILQRNEKILLLPTHGEPRILFCVQASQLSETQKTLDASIVKKLFTPEGALDFIDMDILESLLNARSGNQFIVVITDHYSKPNWVIPTKKTTVAKVTSRLSDESVKSYAIPKRLLASNVLQLC